MGVDGKKFVEDLDDETFLKLAKLIIDTLDNQGVEATAEIIQKFDIDNPAEFVRAIRLRLERMMNK